MRMQAWIVGLGIALFGSFPALAQIPPVSSQAVRTSADRKASDEATHRPHAGMLQFPDISATQITFVYANDIWVAPREGGVASPLASPDGRELYPRFSADGRSIAFVGNYDGNRDLYTIGVDGGASKRITHHPSVEILCDWTDSHGLIFFMNGLAGLPRQTQLFTVPSAGGMPEQLPVPYGANGAVSEDGQWLAYTPHSRDARTWKRYRGGMATDIWLFHLKNHTSEKITDWEGSDSQPMWHGGKVYYMSDGGAAHRLNIWMYDPATKRREQITKHTAYDIKWPAVGPGANGGGEIVYQHGPQLMVLDLATKATREVVIDVPGDRPRIRAQLKDVSKDVQSFEVSSTGKRGVFEARGDIWTLPAKEGAARNLTRTSGTAERDPAWSPDGQWIAYFSDATGEYELYITQSDGRGETKQLTSNGDTYRYAPTWSPDSKRIAFVDKRGDMHLHTIELGETVKFDTEPWSGQPRLNWSADSNWIAYTKGGDNRLSAVWLYNVAEAAKHQVTAGMFNDTWPTFDRKGDFLFLASQRDFGSPAYEDVGQTFIYADTDILLAIPLREDVKSPYAATSDEEKWGDDKDGDKDDDEEADEDKNADEDNEGDSDPSDGDEAGDESSDDKGKEGSDKSDDSSDDDDDDGDDDEEKSDNKKKKKKKEIKPVKIDLDGFENRAIRLKVDRGNFAYLAVNDKGQLLYVRAPRKGSEGKPAIMILDFKKDDPGADEKDKVKEKTVLKDAGVFVMTADGEHIMVSQERKYAVIKAAAGQKIKKTMPLSAMSVTIDPREEWRQIFHEAWRVQRDFFYDPNMHGVDWQAIHDQYAAMIEDCASREDVTFVIGEMISEINVGHAYARGGGDLEDAPSVSVGMLGADYELDQGAYRISKIHQGAAWDVDARGPLSQQGVDVKEGDYLLAVNGVPVDAAKDPWAALQGLAGHVITLTVSDKPAMDDDARHVVVEAMGNEAEVRFRGWIEANRKYVEDKTDGRVGYIYVTNTGRPGQNDLFRQFYGQVDKQALIIDERWNGGGQIPTRFIELLNRPSTNYWAVRDGHDWPWPPDAHQGPKCMLINGLAGSGGDCFPYYFRQSKIGKLIGMRTWGGLVGISGNPTLIDGGRISAPTFAFYETDGTWGVEGHGVDPDIEVVDDPAKMVEGGDPQLDAAIEHMLDELKRNPYRKPARPAYPDRKGMGIVEADK